jgi:hypothetical protein
VKKLFIAAVLVLSLSVGAGDVLTDLKVSKKDASEDVITALVNGNVNFYRVRQVFKNASPGVRAGLVEQTLVWTKAYVNSAQFAKDYAAYRLSAKPEAPERTTTVDQELAKKKAERDAQLAEAKKNIAEMPAEYRKMAQEGYNASVQAMKQMDTPEFRKMERQGIEMERQEEDRSHAERVARWEKEFPVDPKQLVKRRLQEFIRDTANVDYAAKLNGRKFANAAYESKKDEWKLAYRAGKEPTEKARAFAQAWLNELK